MKDSNFLGRPLKNGAKNYEELIFCEFYGATALLYNAGPVESENWE
jgi:hypothetical protein